MSYILDALRRADAERDRGAVPNLHSQVMSPTAAVGGIPSKRAAGLPWIIGAAAGLLVLGGAVYWSLQGQAAKPVLIGPTVAAPPPALAAATAVTPATPAPSSTNAQSPAVTAEAVAAAKPIAQPVRPGSSASVATAPAPSPRSRSKAMPTHTPEPSAVAAGAAQESRVMSRNELPADVQRQLPALAMSGSVYSPQARNRMVIVDGRLSFEGDQVAPGLVLERIEPKSVVMRYQSFRFTVPL